MQTRELAVFFYNIFLWLYGSAIRISSPWNEKAKKWLSGRKNIFAQIQSAFANFPGGRRNLVWVHCASLGEFEQGKPVIEGIRAQAPDSKILVTFFSPSGFEVKRNYPGADYILYLPADSKKNAQRFMNLVKPSLVIFIKYDFWYHYLHEIKKRKINCILVSAVFRKNQAFFSWYGSLQRRMLDSFTRIFVQDETSKKLLSAIRVSDCQVAGDTRFDTVTATAEQFEPIRAIDDFVKNKKCIVAGSTWSRDEKFLAHVLARLTEYDLKLIVAPHEIDAGHLQELKNTFPGSVNFSKMPGNPSPNYSILIIDNIGMLSRLYRYGFITYVGGGFTKDGVHSVLEAAVYGKPVIFGKNYKKYKEASDLIEHDGGKSFSDEDELYQILLTLLTDLDDYGQKCRAAKQYVAQNKGGTGKILDYMLENRLLTR